MGLFPQQFIDDLRLQVNILQVIQEYVPLKKVGATWKGLCPFHSEKTPSFHVNPEKGFFHCFGCGVGGNVFKFLELHEKIGFPEAVRMLAQKAGMAIPETVDGNKDDGAHDAKTREELLKIHEVAAAYFREMLATPAGARARQQLADRDMPQQTIEELGLGFAPNSKDGLKSRLLAQGFAQGLLLQSGLILQRDNGDVIDRFRNRLMIPIYRDTGSVIAFGGRAMEVDQVPKYLNSPETPIYSKSRTLYGLQLSKPAIRKVGFVVLVEGYFDFAQVYRTEAAPVVASCGTALTTQQAHLLRRFTTKIVLSFDPDAAGQTAAVRSCELLVAEGFDVNVAMLNKGEDPDTFIRRHGAAAYRERLRTSRPYWEYVANREAAEVDFRSVDGRNRYLEHMKRFADLFPDEASKEIFAEKVAFIAGLTDSAVMGQFRKSFKSKNISVSQVLPNLGNLKKAEKDLIWGLFHTTDQARLALGDLEPADLERLAGREILELAITLRDQPDDRLPSELLRRLSTVDSQQVTSIAAIQSPAAPPAECVRALKLLRWERERAAIQAQIDKLQALGAGENGQAINALWQRKKDLLHRIEELTS